MSLGNTPRYCTDGDVEKVMQETSGSFSNEPLGTDNVEVAVTAASRWFARKSNAHFYDSGATPDLANSAQSVGDIRLDVPSSPHRQNGQLFRSGDPLLPEQEYPNTHGAGYVRVRLPKRYVSSIDVLNVRDTAGELTDWVSDPDFAQGRGEDYYLQNDGNDGAGRSYLYVRAGSIGHLVNYEDALLVDLTYGLDWQDTEWTDARIGVAHLAAAHLVTDDDVLSQIPDNGQLVGLDTQAERHLNRAMEMYLAPYLEVPVE